MLSLWFFSFFFQFVGYILCHYLFEFQISWSSVYRSGALLCIIFFCHIIIIIVYDGLQKICRQTICRVLFDMNGSERTACWLLLAHIDWECCYLGRANIIRIYFPTFRFYSLYRIRMQFRKPPLLLLARVCCWCWNIFYFLIWLAWSISFRIVIISNMARFFFFFLNATLRENGRFPNWFPIEFSLWRHSKRKWIETRWAPIWFWFFQVITFRTVLLEY